MAVAVLGVGLQLGGVQNSIFAIICYVLAFFLFVGFLTSVIRPRVQPDAQERLDAYFAQVEQWLHGPDAPLRQDDSVRVSAQERTVGILPRLSPEGKRSVLRFLHRHDLIGVGTALISLNNADLRRANLSGLGLQGSLITDANLSKADLSDAKFCNYRPTGADWDRAFVRGVLQSNLSQPIQESYLIGSNLRRAVLRGAELGGCKLRYADFAGADLDEADIRAADLRHARNLTQKQIDSAYGSHNQQGGMSDTLLPQGVKPPKLWERPISQQKGVRKARSH
jgi:uncharacterized protein YjbI with pentapeptide repeats